MILEKIEISGFRGLNALSLTLEENNVLIGENAWGKSSLLDALTQLLAPQSALYQFAPQDFYLSAGEARGQPRTLEITFRFREQEPGDAAAPAWRALAGVWQPATGGLQHVILRFSGRLSASGQVETRREFLDDNGQRLLSGAAATPAIQTLIRLRPVLRLRDARFSRRLPHDGGGANQPQLSALVSQIEALTRDVVSRPHSLSDGALRQGLSTMQQLLEHYFSFQSGRSDTLPRRLSPGQRDARNGWRHLGEINQLITQADSRSRRLGLLRMFALLIQARGAIELDADASPLLLVEDPETRLHPIMLAVTWELLSLLPLQRIATTNSGELIAQVPVGEVCRLVRAHDRVVAWRVGPAGMNAEDSRRIAFHIRFNRPSSLFARCWLLVEGETEVWVINELARQCGYHFAAEGIRVIEFAQCGLRPLVKFAQRMGIDWHVLTDGDDAGKKYAASARSMLHDKYADERRHLTQLPALDMEHFLYKQGFADVYHRTARLPPNVPMNLRRIIAKAIHHSSKPELAIAVAMEAAERGTEAVPPLLRNMFARLQGLAQGKAD